MGDLLPSNATAFEKALSNGIDFSDRLNPTADIAAGIKLRDAPESFLPYLNYEYGLGPIARFFPNVRERITAGIEWQRKLGTHTAIDLALQWLQYSGNIEHFPPRRTMWNRWMLALNEFRENEEPDLNDIDYLMDLSAPVRSDFWRGFHVYDVRGLEFGYTKYGDTLLSDFSGERIRSDGAKWSYGRNYTLRHALTEEQLTALGAWLPPTGGEVGWGNFTWASSNFPWVSLDETTRKQLILSAVANRPIWIVFYDNANNIIGYRRSKVVARVVSDVNGCYEFDGQRYKQSATNGTHLYMEFMTDFTEGYGATSAFWRLSFDNEPVDPETPGLLWAEEDELTSGIELLNQPQVIEFGRTVREDFKLLFRIEEDPPQAGFRAIQTLSVQQTATLKNVRQASASQTVPVITQTATLAKTGNAANIVVVL